MQSLSKYDQLAMVIQATASVAAVGHTEEAVACVANFIALGQPPLSGQNIVETYQADVATMADQYLAYCFDGGPKPEWVQHITG